MTSDDDPFADLSDEFDIEADLARAEQHLTIRTETRRYGKAVTIVEGFEPDVVDVKAVATTLKKKLGVGGTVEGGRIELQGSHADRLPALLVEQGFTVEG